MVRAKERCLRRLEITMSGTKRKLLAWGASYLEFASFAGIPSRTLLATAVVLTSGLVFGGEGAG